MSDIPLILFAKVPRAGKVKTRLMPELSYETAADVACVLLNESLKLATEHWQGKVILALWPDVQDEFIQAQIKQYNVETQLQVPGDLGTKMLAAMQSVSYPCAVMGCDAPHLSGDVLQQAHALLVKGESVLGPTHDGGYYLMGLQKSQPTLFSNQVWGGMTVLETSVEKAKEQHFSFSLLETVSDIDTYEDLLQASKKLPILKQFLLTS